MPRPRCFRYARSRHREDRVRADASGIKDLPSHLQWHASLTYSCHHRMIKWPVGRPERYLALRCRVGRRPLPEGLGMLLEAAHTGAGLLEGDDSVNRSS